MSNNKNMIIFIKSILRTYCLMKFKLKKQEKIKSIGKRKTHSFKGTLFGGHYFQFINTLVVVGTYQYYIQMFTMECYYDIYYVGMRMNDI
jgi:hypothetical protein